MACRPGFRAAAADGREAGAARPSGHEGGADSVDRAGGAGLPRAVTLPPGPAWVHLKRARVGL
ncbi:hypothetical protein GCM10017674_66430 [Streptomyces gardneri]|uniref:Uncharacterized protein n=1 Tax=Streptomyces gardneri TaxID=66892 RepID=A0A4Y3RIA4_9ACTN|nr:hypothetical protein SGA01_27190 [Streptomyces gardneri]GHH16473.1 hypothetical protein GCM10017674_66430 [Streptomyces gardneri]